MPLISVLWSAKVEMPQIQGQPELLGDCEPLLVAFLVTMTKCPITPLLGQ